LLFCPSSILGWKIILIFTTIADTLELKAEKQNAHSDWISSVGFSPDGKTIVSGSYDKTLKVWAAGARFFAPL
jgi:WD40 repeat protein